jgi:signal transduction histidine kinase
VTDELRRRQRLERFADALLHVAELSHTPASAQPGVTVRALIDAVGAATGGSASLLRRAADGTYGVVTALDARPSRAGRAAQPGLPFRLEDAPADELALPIPGSGAAPELVVVIRYGDDRPDESDRAALSLVAAAFAIAVGNVALYAESERRRVELLDARATQAELVARLARDVRGPVTSIVGFARLLEEDGRFPQDAREALAMIRGNGERVAELAADVDLLSRIELAAVEPQWRAVDVTALVQAAGAVVDMRATTRIVADPDLLGTALGRLVEDGRRPSSPVRARVENLEEAAVIELAGTGASPAGEPAAPSIGGRLAARIVERHGGSFRTGAANATWWIRLTLPTDPRRAQRRLRTLLVGSAETGDQVAAQLRGLGFAVQIAGDASEVRAALATSSADVVLVPTVLSAWAGIDRLSAELRRRAGLVALGGDEGLRNGWDATVAALAAPADLRAAVYAAAAKARLRRAAEV